MQPQTQSVGRIQPVGTVDALAVAAGSAFCGVIVACERPVFNGSIWRGGGMKNCSRTATIKGPLHDYCTYHARRAGLLPNTTVRRAEDGPDTPR
jgi:hypothetical protein